MRAFKSLQAAGTVVSIIRRSLIVLVVREIEPDSTPAGNTVVRLPPCNDAREQIHCPRQLVDLCVFIQSVYESIRSKARSMANHVAHLFISRAARILTRRST